MLNTTAAIITLFKEKRDIAATWAWLLVLNLLPVVGFVIYLFAGKKISKEKIFDLVAVHNEKSYGDLLTDEARQTVRALLVADDAIKHNGCFKATKRGVDNVFFGSNRDGTFACLMTEPEVGQKV